MRLYKKGKVPSILEWEESKEKTDAYERGLSGSGRLKYSVAGGADERSGSWRRDDLRDITVISAPFRRWYNDTICSSSWRGFAGFF